MGCIPALACKAVLAQATELWPDRSRASDGICPSAAHSATNPTSDHEVGNAVDLTHDPDHGCDAHAWARELVARQDARVKYVISQGQIAAGYPVAGGLAWTWRPYSGINPHDKHAHVSIVATARDDMSPWFDDPSDEEDTDMTSAQEATLNAIAEELGKLAVIIRDPASGLDPQIQAMADELGKLAVVIRDQTTGMSTRLDAVLAKLDALAAGAS